jgi:very-short-patch-repair endonuclease
MSVRRPPTNPSPLAGEDAARSAAGEGSGGAVLRGGDAGSRGPSPGRSLHSQPASPARGEGKLEDAARSAAGEGSGGAVLRGGDAGSRGPSPGRSLRSQPSSPARGEGVNVLHRRARQLRSRMTNAERKMWYALRDRRFAGFKFRRQVPIGHFIADFVCFDARLVIELDGGQHADSVYDRRRDQWFTRNQFRVLRFWNNEVLSNLEGVMTVLADALTAEQTS